MSCEYCGGLEWHDYRCPNYIPPRLLCGCEFCREYIAQREEYIENYDGEYVHVRCIPSIYYLLDFLNIKVHEMEKNDEYSEF